MKRGGRCARPTGLPALLTCWLVGWATLVSTTDAAQTPASPRAAVPAPVVTMHRAAPVLEVYTRAGCPHCAAAHAFLPRLLADYPGLVVRQHDVVEDASALTRLRALSTAHGIAMPGVPAFQVGETLLVGFDSAETSGRQLRRMLDAAGATAVGEAAGSDAGLCLPRKDEAGGPDCAPARDGIRLFGHEFSAGHDGLPLFSFLLGLVDGFNPCSMWVLLFMLAMLAPLGDRRRMLAVMLTFVVVEGMAYFAFMAAWLNAFALVGVSSLATLAIALAGLAAGAVHIKDFFAPGRGPSLSIPAAARPGIYARVRRIVAAERLVPALLATVALALLVQVVEFACTAGLPALFTRVLSLGEHAPWQRYGYLALYNLAYMLDDIIVLGIGVATFGRHRLRREEGRWLKLASGVVLIALSAYLAGQALA